MFSDFTIGIDIGGTRTKLGLVDSRGKVIRRRTIATQPERGPRRTLVRIADTIKKLCGGQRASSAGVGIAGLVDHHEGIVRLPPNLPGWHGAPVRAILTDLLEVPVYCSNDANAVTLGEWLHGAGQGSNNLLCLTLGTGVGAGIISDGRMLLGANHAAAELGHITIFGNGPVCRCGNRGCLERYVGAEYIVERCRIRLRAQARRVKHSRNQLTIFSDIRSEQPSLLFAMTNRSLSDLDTRKINRAARQNDPLALKVIEETGHYLGLGIASAVALLDPELVIIGGGVSGLGRPLLQATSRTVLSRVPLFSGRRLEIVLSELGSNAGIIGAARLPAVLHRS
ncbi:MAG: ROK family protein [candidate division WOR-3 bacterium]